MSIKAKRTEYKGIVFDSKSEAVFARTLDIGGHEWVYHPAEHCGHAWDFIVCPVHRSSRLCSRVGGHDYYWQRPHFRTPPMLVEYKPTMPTKTYVDNLTDQMRQDPLESVVVWGNPWDGVDKTLFGPTDCCYRVYPIFSSHQWAFGWGDFDPVSDSGNNLPVSYRHETLDVLGINESMAQEAKLYRFDLAHSIDR